MTVEKFSVSLPAELVADIDRLAEEQGLSRSGLIREATARYTTAADAESASRARRQHIDEALAGFDEIAASWGANELSSLELLAEVRSRHPGTGAPPTPPAREGTDA